MTRLQQMTSGALVLLGLSGLALAAPPPAGPRPIIDTAELVLTREAGRETVAMPGDGYRDFVLDGEHASFVIDGQALPAGSRQLRGNGIKSVSWTPQGSGKRKSTLVELEFAQAPGSSLLNAVSGTPGRPQTPQVLAGFLFDPNSSGKDATPSVMGGRSEAGSYKLPKFPDVQYSDALVTLKVVNADFRDVLGLLCRIGGVSYAIDPYYEDEPTGNRRSGKGSGSGGNTGGGPGGQPGFPQDGTGSITLNFYEVPFDQALDLLLETAGLVKADIY